MKRIKLNINIISILAIIYFYIPCVLFCGTWLKSIVAVLVLFGITISLIGMIKTILSSKNKYITINIIWFIFTILIVFFIGHICGWSGYGHQTEDWPKHNAILSDLLQREWPVIYENGEEKGLLTYYIGQYLAPAFLGKIFDLSFKTTLLLSSIWSSVGLCLVVFLFYTIADAKTLSKQVMCLSIILLGGGLMVLQQAIGYVMYPEAIPIGQQGWRDYFLTYGEYVLQYRTNFISIRWAFGQTIVPWIISLLLYNYWDKVKIYIPLVIPSILFGTFSSVSIVLMAVMLFMKYCYNNRDIKIILKKTFSLWNIISFFTFGIVLILYYLGYILQDKPESMGFSFVHYNGNDIGIYLIFILGAFGLYTVIMVKEYYKDVLFWFVVVWMMILPFFKMGVANDLLMGACIAPSMILYLMIAKWLFIEETLLSFRKGIMVVLLMVAFIKPTMEIYECLNNYDYTEYTPDDWYGSMEAFIGRERENVPDDLKYNYYTYEADDCLFMKYIGKK